MKTRWIVIFLTLSGLLLLTKAFGDKVKQQRLHSPDEILKIMEESELSYVIGELTDSILEIDSPIVLHNQYFILTHNDTNSLDEYIMSEQTTKLLQIGDKEFANKNFEAALKYYHQMLESQPEYSFALTMIGDAHYSIGNYDSAKVYFSRAVDRNFVDYSAHWFLADTYDKMGKLDSALKEISIAHLLNINHSVLKSKLQEYRESANHHWQEWDFNPQYQLSKDGDQIFINTHPDWIAYAMVKAVWEYEPGYAYKTSNEPDSLLVNWPEEKEAIVSLLTDTTRNQRIYDIIEEGYFEEFVVYELVSKKHPIFLLLLSEENFWQIFDYVEKYH